MNKTKIRLKKVMYAIKIGLLMIKDKSFAKFVRGCIKAHKRADIEINSLYEYELPGQPKIWIFTEIAKGVTHVLFPIKSVQQHLK